MTLIRERGGYLYVTTADGWTGRHRLDQRPKPPRFPAVTTTGEETIRGVTRRRVYSAAAPHQWVRGRMVPPMPGAE